MQTSDIPLRELDDDGVLRLTLNDPGWPIALPEAMLGRLGAAFAEDSADPSMRVPTHLK